MSLLNEITGYNANRKIFDGGTDISEEIDGVRGMLAPPIFQVAVVVDIVGDPSRMSNDRIFDLENQTSTPELVKRAPRNSIIARIITRNQDLFDQSPRILFPVNIFDADPVKPGEQVFVFFVDPIVNDQVGYWWKRVPQPIDTDDLNFTHADRKYQINEGNTTADRIRGANDGPPNFINGGENDENNTLAGTDAYDEINDNAEANSQIVKEPVARFVKRPGDKVIMGSNASRIVLGLDRAGAAPAGANKTVRAKSATIDMVVGYGREGTPTAPTAVVNSRGDQEVDKSPQAISNPSEGDPDMTNDPSRVYISESTNVDTNFSVNVPGIAPSAGNAPSVAVKSDRIRLLANGDIKIVGNNGSVIVDQSGNISIIGQVKVNLGEANPTLGVARMTDEVSADTSMLQWLIQAQVVLTAAAGVAGLPAPVFPSDFGIITSASTKVFSE